MKYDAYIWIWNIMCTTGDGICCVQYNWRLNMLRITEDWIQCFNLELEYIAYIWCVQYNWIWHMLRTSEYRIFCVHLEIEYNAYIWSWNTMRTSEDGIWCVQYNWTWNMLRTPEDVICCVHLEIEFNAYIWSWNTKRTSGDGLKCIHLKVQNANIEFKCTLKELKIVQRLILLFCEFQVQSPK